MVTIFVRAIGFMLVIALGYFLKIRGVVKKEDASIFSTIVMNVTLPCALLTSAAAMELTEHLYFPLLLGFAMNFLMDTVGYMEAKGRSGVARAVGLVQISGYNIGTFTMPFVQAFFPAAYLVPVMLFDMGNALMVLGGNYTLAKTLHREGEQMGVKAILKNLFGSIPFAIYVLSFILAAVGISLPSEVLSITTIAGNANPFLAMLMLGILLDIKVDQKELLHLFKLVGLRFAVSAVCGGLIYFFLPVSLIMRQMLVICLFSPISVVAPVYALKLGSKSSESANLNSLCILLSLCAMTALMLLFSHS